MRQRIKSAGLTDIYEIAECGVEGLSEWGIVDESIDSVITILCLCSVSKPEEMIRDLYRKLRKGGIWAVYEHVVTKQGGFISWYQCKLCLFYEGMRMRMRMVLMGAALINIAWPHFLGGCSIRRDTEKSLREVGEWSKVGLKPASEVSYQVLPHIIGILEK